MGSKLWCILCRAGDGGGMSAGENSAGGDGVNFNQISDSVAALAFNHARAGQGRTEAEPDCQ